MKEDEKWLKKLEQNFKMMEGKGKKTWRDPWFTLVA